MPTKKLKRFRVQIELGIFETLVFAKTEAEARRKAIEKLSMKNPAKMIHRSWPDNEKQISVSEN